MKFDSKHCTIFALTLLMLTSCNNDDDVPVITKKDPILRTITIISDEFPICESDLSFEVELEILNDENGDLVRSIDVFCSFEDNTPDNGKGGISTESLVESISNSTFTIDALGIPQFSYQASLSTLLSATGLSESDIDGGDQFNVRFELVLNDGTRSFFNENTGTINALFLYPATVISPPTTPTPGTWNFSTTDAFGDGWTGASLEVSLNRGTPTSIINIDDGTRPFASSTQEYTLEVPVGTERISIIYTSGAFDGEVAFTITSASGNIIATQEAYSGTNPTPGVELINYCIQNF